MCSEGSLVPFKFEARIANGIRLDVAITDATPVLSFPIGVPEELNTSYIEPEQFSTFVTKRISDGAKTLVNNPLGALPVNVSMFECNDCFVAIGTIVSVADATIGTTNPSKQLKLIIDRHCPGRPLTTLDRSIVVHVAIVLRIGEDLARMILCPKGASQKNIAEYAGVTLVTVADQLRDAVAARKEHPDDTLKTLRFVDATYQATQKR
jgi:hypothetical protein